MNVRLEGFRRRFAMFGDSPSERVKRSSKIDSEVKERPRSGSAALLSSGSYGGIWSTCAASARREGDFRASD